MIKIGQYDYPNLINSFLIQDRTSASTAQDRMSYNGTKLFSYNSLLANIDMNSSILYINKTISNYSLTSARQTKILIEKARPKWIIFSVHPDMKTEQNLVEYWKEVETLIKKHNRSRINKSYVKAELHKLIKTTQHFAEIHNLDSTIPDHIMRQLFIYQLLS